MVSRRNIVTAVLGPRAAWRRGQARSRPSLKALLRTAEPRIEALAPERGRARRRAVVELGGKGVSA
ncbi:MAG: prevent-host-death protein [Cyanobacteriota bacterium]